ncbi:MAG: hypothetical protein IPP82_12715 [Xanthomonadales bacterium]|nr:hypothetical protein [Xanthomonadales bacterium]
MRIDWRGAAPHLQGRKRSLSGRLPFGKLLVAIANKHARQLWVMLAREAHYDPHTGYHPTLQRTQALA